MSGWRRIRRGCLLPFLLVIPAGHAETLEDALTIAYRNNPALEGSRDLRRAAEEGVVQTRAAYGPSLSLSARHEFTAARVRGGGGPSQDQGFGTTAELALSQPLFTSGRLSAAVDAATANSLAVRAKLEEASQQTISDVVTAYVFLQRDIELYGVAVEIYQLLLKQRDQTLSRYRLRDSTAPDVDQTLNRLELAAGRVISSRADVMVSAARYRNLVGHYPDSLSPLPALPDLPMLETLYVEAEAYNPTLAASKYTETGSRAAVAAARAEMMPQIGGYASALRAPIAPYQNTYRQESVSFGVRMTMPLYTGGQMSSALRAAKDRNLADQQFVEQARRDMRERLAADWSRLQAIGESLPRFDAAVDAAERALDGVERQETAGIRTLRDVLDVTNDLLSARTAAVQARTEAYALRVAVLRDAGILGIEMFSRERPYDSNMRPRWQSRVAGLPLRPLLEPLDRLAKNSSTSKARVQLEYSLEFDGLSGKEAPLQPVSEGPLAESGQ